MKQTIITKNIKENIIILFNNHFEIVLTTYIPMIPSKLESA